jgi:hypothetical protein
MNKTETGAILRILRTVWPNEQITPDRITAYQWAFEDLEYLQVEDACKRWMKTGKFFPKPAELLEIIATETVAPEIIPEAAFAEVIKQAGRVGLTGTPQFSHPLIARAVEEVTWYAICMTDMKDYPTLRAQFRDALKGLKAHAIQKQQVGGRRDSLTPLPVNTDLAIESEVA